MLSYNYVALWVFTLWDYPATQGRGVRPFDSHANYKTRCNVMWHCLVTGKEDQKMELERRNQELEVENNQLESKVKELTETITVTTSVKRYIYYVSRSILLV